MSTEERDNVEVDRDSLEPGTGHTTELEPKRESTYRDRLAEAIKQSVIARSGHTSFNESALLQSAYQHADAVLAVRDEELERLREQLAALMDPDGAERIKAIEAELEALPEAERIRREAQSAPYLRIELAAWVRKAKEAKVELEKTAESAAKEIWVKMGFDTILHWKARAEKAEAERDRLKTLTATCSCGDTYATYEGPEPDCPVHGAVRALNEAQVELAAAKAAIERVRQRAYQLARQAPDDDWGDTPAETVAADIGRSFLWILDTPTPGDTP